VVGGGEEYLGEADHQWMSGPAADELNGWLLSSGGVEVAEDLKVGLGVGIALSVGDQSGPVMANGKTGGDPLKAWEQDAAEPDRPGAVLLAGPAEQSVDDGLA